MAGQNITKIYELKTLNYNEVIQQLHSIDAAFKSISVTKKALNNQRLGTQDTEDLKKINDALNEAKIKHAELKLQKQQLTNESLAMKNAKQAETNAIKANTSALIAEAGSYQDSVNKQKELYALLKNTREGGTIRYNNQTLSFEQAIQEYKRLAAAEQAFRRQFQADSVLIGEYTTGIVNAFKRLGLDDLLGQQAGKAKQRLKELDTELIELRNELARLKAAGQSFDSIERKIIDNRVEAERLSTQLIGLQNNMRGFGGIGQQVTTALSNGFASMKQQLSQMVLTYVSFFAAFREISAMVQHNKELSDSFSDLQIRIKGSKEDTEALFESLKKIDTRTSLASLVDIANIVAKKGVAQDEIAGLTEALDKLFIVLGKEAGEPAEATASIVKLISIFNEDKQVTKQRVEEIGTALIKLTTSGVATGSFLIDFAERVGAVRGITGLTLPNIFGMGAALEQLGQRAEVAGTAAIQLTTKLFSNVPKFAEAAKMSVEEFRKLLASNPFDALVAVAESLAGLTDEKIAADFEEITEAFGEVQVRGARVKEVLGDIATNGKFVQERMKAAAVSTEDLGNAAAAAELKQRNFAATLDRIKKQFEIFGTSETVRAVMLAVAAIISGLIQSLPVLLVLVGLLTTTWIAQNAALIALRIQLVLYNISLGAMYIAQSALYVLNGLYIASLAVLRAAYAALIIVTRTFSAVLAATPFGFILTGAALLIGSYESMAGGFKKAETAVKELTKAQIDAATKLRISNEIREKANTIVGDQISKLQSLVAIVVSEKTGYDTAKLALDKLIQSHAQFGEAINNNIIDLDKVKSIMSQVTKEIQLQANAQASAELSAEKYKKYLEAVTLRQKVEQFLASGKSTSGNDAIDFTAQLKQDERSTFLGTGQTLFSPAQMKALKDEEKRRLDTYLQYNAFAADAQKQAFEAQVKREKVTEEIQRKTAEQLRLEGLSAKLSAEELESLINGIEAELKKLKEGDPKIAQLQRQRDIFQARLDALNGRTKSVKSKRYAGARLSGQDKDELAEIDAQTKLLVTAEETRFARLQLVIENGQEKLREASYDEELAYLKRIRDINDNGLELKILYLEKKNKLNAREQDALATFYKQQADNQIDYLKKVKQLNKEEFDEQEDKIKKQMEAQVALLQEDYERLKIDPNISEEAKAVAKKAMDDKILELTKQYYIQLDALAVKYSISNKNIEEQKQKTLSELIKKGLINNLNITKAILADIEKAHERNVANINAAYSRLKLKVLESDDSDAKKRKKLSDLDREQAIVVAASIEAAAKVKYDQIKKDYEAGKALLIDLEKAETDYVNASRKKWELMENVPSTLNKIRQGVRGLAESLGEMVGLNADGIELLAQAFELAELSMDSYFDAEERRIERSLEMQEKKLDIELRQLKDRAQSRAEEESLERQYAEKKETLEKEAFERKKKLQLQQVKMNYAIELSNIAVAASANPLNPFTFGAAGVAQYIIQAALATAKYLINRNSILSAQYEFGGNPDMTTTRGGKVKGRPHSQGGNPFIFKGRVFEDEVDELNIIRTKNVRDNVVYTLQGTHTQIASKLNQLGGGTQFAPGAKMFANGGILGSGYTIPMYTPSSQYNPDIFISEIRNLAYEQSQRIDRLEVIQDVNTVTKAQKKVKQQNDIGTI